MSNYTDTLQRGDKIGCYRIEEVLGRGGFAVTYLATDENLDVEVAIKEYLPREITQRDANLHVSARKQEFAEDYEVGLANFAREAKTLARFKHPHIVRVHQVLHANSTAYMVMDFEKGQELAEILEHHQTLPEDELRAILFPILDGVEEIHRHGFVHRDIKPSNIYIRHNGSPVLIDFGAARYTMSETTQQLTAVVTVGYTPIEQYNVSEDAQGPWSDIYALAAVCYEAVAGDVPTDSVTRASASVTNGDDPLPSVRNHTKRAYSDDCLDAIDWGLRMDAEDRPQVIAQWRDAFDGIFNPASAYVAQKDVSIYSPHRVDKPLQSRPEVKPTGRTDDIVSIPLRPTDTPLDAGVVSLHPDSTRPDSAVAPLPTAVSNRSNSNPTVHANPNYADQNHLSRNDEFNEADHNPAIPPIPASNSPSTHADTKSANDPSPRNVLRRDTQPPPQAQTSQNQDHAGKQPRKRSKLERPSHLAEEPPVQRKRTLRDEIEFDETDWDYVPPNKSSPWKLLLPALGLAAVVGGSVLYVNFPELITNLGKGGPELTTEQALGLAKQKLDASEHILPAGESAVDYYQLILKDDPNNAEAKAGIQNIESAVREKIADNMRNNNYADADKLLARADQVGLTGLYSSPEQTAQTPTTTPDPTSTTTTGDVVEATQDTIITPVNTASIEPAPQTATQPQIDTTPSTPATGIDNNLSPYIQGKIAEINSLVEQKQFAAARVVYNETDKFIPDQTVSRTLLQKIEAGEAELLVQNSPPVNATSETTTTTTTIASAETTTPITAPTPIAAVEPPRNSYTDGSGPAADHLDQLRLALEAKDIEAVKALSQSLPEGRIRFLNNTFARHHRLDVIIDNVSTNGDTITGRLNVAMFGKSDDGSLYGAGKWNGAVVTATRSNGEWQKIRW